MRRHDHEEETSICTGICDDRKVLGLGGVAPGKVDGRAGEAVAATANELEGADEAAGPQVGPRRRAGSKAVLELLHVVDRRRRPPPTAAVPPMLAVHPVHVGRVLLPESRRKTAGGVGDSACVAFANHVQ